MVPISASHILPTFFFFKRILCFFFFAEETRGVPHFFWVAKNQVLESWSTGDVGCPRMYLGSQGGEGHLSSCQFTGRVI